MNALTDASNCWTCDAPPIARRAMVALNGGLLDCGVTGNGYVCSVRLGGAWYYVDVLSAQFRAAVQRAYEEREQ